MSAPFDRGRQAEPVQPTWRLRAEHDELIPSIESMLRVADSTGTAALVTLLTSVDNIYEFLTRHLVAHAYAEEQVLYPLVENAMVAPGATATMRRDHVEIAKLAGQLGDLRRQLITEPLNAYRANEMRRLLYSLYTLTRLHFAKEEEIYLALLDSALTVEEMDRAYKEMEKAAEHAREMPEIPLVVNAGR